MLAGMAAAPAQGLTVIAGMEFAHVPGGTFPMGHADFSDAPVRQTTVRDVRMGVAPVTNAQMDAYIAWRAEDTHGNMGVYSDGRERVLGIGPDGRAKQILQAQNYPHLRDIGGANLIRVLENVRLVPDPARYQKLSSDVFARANHPAALVSWREAVAFAAWISHISGILVRLPTEAEWERAAKGPDGNHDYATPNGQLRDDRGNLQVHVEHYETTDKQYGTAAVRTYAPNPFGIYDLSGNVWEWILDLYGVYDPKATDNPTGPSEGRTRVLRGGSWYNSAEGARSAYRDNGGPVRRGNDGGFRLAAPFQD